MLVSTYLLSLSGAGERAKVGGGLNMCELASKKSFESIFRSNEIS